MFKDKKAHERIDKLTGEVGALELSRAYHINRIDSLEGNLARVNGDVLFRRIVALENMVALLVGALGKEFVEQPEVPAVPAVPARMVVRDLPKAKR